MIHFFVPTYLVVEGAVPPRRADELLLLEGVREGEAAVLVRLRDHVLCGEAPGAPAHLAHESGKSVGRVGWRSVTWARGW